MTDQQTEWRCPACMEGADTCSCSEETIAAAQARKDAGAEMVVDASSQSQVAARARKAKLADGQDTSDMKWLMNHQQGRRIMWKLLERCSVFRNAFVRAEGDAGTVAFNCGEQNIGLSYFAELVGQHSEGYNLMVKENSGRLSA